MDEDAFTTYRGLLVEVKYRVEAIDGILRPKEPMHAFIAEEIGYLQLRMICELLAIGCLVMHGDVAAAKPKLLKQYKASVIINEMAKLHPKFFPRPLENEDSPGDGRAREWIYRKSGFLTQELLCDLWHKSGEKLHRGSLKNILKGESEPNFKEIQDWRNKIVFLLNRHTIPTPGEDKIGYFAMDNGKNEVYSVLFLHSPNCTNTPCAAPHRYTLFLQQDVLARSILGARFHPYRPVSNRMP